jgi:CubicO group peptidase (beta-lactamase class C family)
MNASPLLVLLAAIAASEPAPRTSSADPQPGRLIGLWQAKRRFGPDVRGTLVIDRRAGNWQALAEGTYHDETPSLWLPSSGGTFDFSRVKSTDSCDFYPRGRPGAPYVYAPPRQEDDGCPTASLDDVGLSRTGIERFVRMLIDTPMDSIHAPQIHGVLIARHGKLVLEEYFHGEAGDKLHDTRSAAKSLTATLLGAAIRAGMPIDVSTPVYSTMNGGTLPSGLDPRKRAMTVEHLLTMSSGLDCDDSNDNSPGNEDVMQDQTKEPDWYRYTMALPMVRTPGEKSVYGSTNPNLLGGVLGRISGRWLPDLFHDLLAEPLGITRYAMNLTPTGDAYMGGGVRFRPRDFMKFGQLMLDGGQWHGRAIATPEWCLRATSPLCKIAGRNYGCLWWMADYPYKAGTVRAFFAGGNGGQIVMGIPDLDLVIAFYGGSYSDRVSLLPQQEYVPKYILAAVQDAH